MQCCNSYIVHSCSFLHAFPLLVRVPACPRGTVYNLHSNVVCKCLYNHKQHICYGYGVRPVSNEALVYELSEYRGCGDLKLREVYILRCTQCEQVPIGNIAPLCPCTVRLTSVKSAQTEQLPSQEWVWSHASSAAGVDCVCDVVNRLDDATDLQMRTHRVQKFEDALPYAPAMNCITL